MKIERFPLYRKDIKYDVLFLKKPEIVTKIFYFD